MLPSVPVGQRYSILEGFVSNGLNHETLKKPENAQLKHLLSKRLSINPSERPSATEVLQDPYFQDS
ncbi:protein kinase family protein [Endozoicomonas numazuensis]|uniref:Protein kinase domain-containing protein n=1 Tax=Endozoicomonas numazuensis TaxID=1137799 RepID=A0A081NFP1_9GAMM|nr:hypothetical protein [Endozoicomonas numazuensis]KEQ17264.1 hypothetical protein GZ78_15685 [Endozoicomonas numazuensis]